MKIRWKITISTLIVLAIGFGIGGFWLLSSVFHLSLEQKINAVQEQNKMYLMILDTMLQQERGQDFMGIQDGTTEKQNMGAVLNKIADSISGRFSADQFDVRLSDDNGEVIYATGGVEQISRLSSEQVQGRYTVITVRDNYYLQLSNALDVGSQIITVETFWDIHEIFTLRDSSFEIYRYLSLILVLLLGCLLVGITYWMMRPLTVLNRASKQIADGKLKLRVHVKSRDEIGQLAEAFNYMADQLDQKMEQLTLASKRQEDFTASFAHEIKTPLTGIIGYADMMRSRRMEEQQQFEMADRIFREGKRLESLSRKLLDLIVLQKKGIERKPVMIDQIVAKVTNSYHVPEEKFIQLSVQVEPVRLMLESDLFHTLLLNLLDNAQKAITQRGRIQIRGYGDEDCFYLEIADDGIGIEQQEIRRITEAFYMVDKSRSRSKGGSGLGLALCTQIALLHGRALDIQSVPGAGTSVMITILREVPDVE